MRAERIARAFELFWDGHPDGAAHVLVPRLESTLRDLAEAEGALVHKSPVPGRYAGAVSLNVIMRLLRELTDDEDWTCYLEDLLCEPLAVNLRNNIAHGLLERVEGVHAALLLQAACFLLRLQPRPAEPA